MRASRRGPGCPETARSRAPSPRTPRAGARRAQAGRRGPDRRPRRRWTPRRPPAGVERPGGGRPPRGAPHLPRRSGAPTPAWDPGPGRRPRPPRARGTARPASRRTRDHRLGDRRASSSRTGSIAPRRGGVPGAPSHIARGTLAARRGGLVGTTGYSGSPVATDTYRTTGGPPGTPGVPPVPGARLAPVRAHAPPRSEAPGPATQCAELGHAGRQALLRAMEQLPDAVPARRGATSAIWP